MDPGESWRTEFTIEPLLVRREASSEPAPTAPSVRPAAVAEPRRHDEPTVTTTNGPSPAVHGQAVASRAADDPDIPALRDALDTSVAGPAIAAMLAAHGDAPVTLVYVHVVRHEPGLRCVVEYGFTSPRGPFTVIGTVRASGADVRTFELHHALCQRGFGAGPVRVPRPLGIARELSAWWQRAVPGTKGTEALATGGARTTARIAEALARLHAADPVPGLSRHSWDDELRDLENSLTWLVRQRPDWGSRLAAIAFGCVRSCSELGARPERLIHRDFTPDRVAVDGAVVYLLDLERCSLGDPALDVGSFVAHVLADGVRPERSLETAWWTARAFVEHYLELTEGDGADAIDAATTVTLARLVTEAWRTPERRSLAERVLEACEAHLDTRPDT